MFSRRNESKGINFLKHVGLLLVLGLGVCACSMNFGEKKEAAPALKLNSDKFTCLSKIGEKIESYFGAEMSLAETEQFYTCIQASFDTFQVYARGVEKDSYSPNELRAFLESDVIYPKKIGDGFMSEAMNLKMAFLGGTADKITRAELKRFAEFLEILKDASTQFQPHMATLNPSVAMERTPDFVDRLGQGKSAGESAIQIAQLLGREIGNIAQPLRLEHLGGFVVELARFIYGDSEKLERAKLWAQMISTVKPILVGGSPEILEPSNWKSFLEGGLAWYLVFVRSKYEASQGSFFYGPVFADFVDNVNRGFQLIQNSLNSQPDKLISFNSLERLFFGMKALDIVPWTITSQSFTEFMPVLVNKAFGDLGKAPQFRLGNGITGEHLNQAHQEFKRWAAIQSYLESQLSPGYRNELAKSSGGGNKSLKLDWELSSIGKMGIDITADRGGGLALFGVGFEGRETDFAIGELKSIIERVRPFFKQGEGRTYLTYKDEIVKVQGFYNLSIMNVVRGLTRLLVRGYSEEPSRAAKMEGVTQTELSEFFKSIRGIGGDLKILDRRNVESLGGRVYTEGNVFTYLGNALQESLKTNQFGDLLDFGETVELISLVFSGNNLGSEMYQQALSSCETGPLDFFDRPKLKRECFSEIFFSRIGDWLTQLPQMKNYWQNLTVEERHSALMVLSRMAVRPVQDDLDYIEIAANPLVGTRPIETCVRPGILQFGPWGRSAHDKFEKCQIDNYIREERLEKVVARLEKGGFQAVDCAWSGSIELSKSYCDWIEAGEMATISVVIHYIETILTRFDLDLDGRITSSEAWEAFPVFRGLIDRVAKANGFNLEEKRLREVYAFLLSEGRIPTKQDFLWKMASVGSSLKIDIDRMGLLKIFEIFVGGGKSKMMSASRELAQFRKQKEKEQRASETSRKSAEEFEFAGP
ncbi:MAG: hypothetical protein IPL83_05675 [Bdellovibrionales bacterium]|nr:hypothetical protein [Bdellovibrionales bacterium]